MRLIIDIPEEIKQKRDAGKVLSSEEIATVCMAIKNSTPLPERHGRLVDADRLEQVQNERLQDGEIRILELKLITSALDDAETVIEADGGAE